MRKQVLVVLLAMVANLWPVGMVFGQEYLDGDTVRGAHSFTMGLESRESWRDASLSYEWLLGKRLVANLSIGTGLKRYRPAGMETLDGITWRYFGSLQFKHIFLLNKKHPLGGFYSILHFGYHRRAFQTEKEGFPNFRSFRAEIGPGVGFQWVFGGRVMVGTSGIIAWAMGEDWRGYSNAETIRSYHRAHFLFIRNIRVGVTF